MRPEGVHTTWEIRAAAIRGIDRLIDDLGGDGAALLAEFGVASADLDSDHGLLPTVTAGRILRRATKTLDCLYLAVDASCNLERLRKALLSVVLEGYANSVGIYFDEVQLPLLALYQRGVHFHNGKGHARPNMTPTLEAVAAGTLHPELVTSSIHAWHEIPDVLTSAHAGHKPIFVLEK